MLKVISEGAKQNLCDMHACAFVLVPPAETVLDLKIVAMSNTSIAGEGNNFICTVTTTVNGFEYPPLAVWVENGSEITEQRESTANLNFRRLNTSHGKVYTCQGNLSSPALSMPLILMENYSLVVKSKFPFYILKGAY